MSSNLSSMSNNQPLPNLKQNSPYFYTPKQTPKYKPRSSTQMSAVLGNSDGQRTGANLGTHVVIHC